MLTFRNAVLATVGAVALSLSGLAAAPAYAAADPLPRCTDSDSRDLLCLTLGELGEEGIRTRVGVEDILCVRADVLSEDYGHSTSEIVDARVRIPCGSHHHHGYKECNDTCKPVKECNDTCKDRDDEVVVEKEVVKRAPKAVAVVSDLVVTH